MIKYICKYFGFILFLFLFGCNNYYEQKLNNKNPTEYIFDKNSFQIKKAIKTCLGKYQINGLALYLKEDNRFEILNIIENENDAYLRTFIDYMDSKVYFKKNNPLKYTADFHIHLDSLAPNKTRVTVITINPRIITGIKPGIGDNFTFGSSNFKSVQPSTIEEYEIILKIGKELGQQGMPPCNYPDSTKKIKHFHFL